MLLWRSQNLAFSVWAEAREGFCGRTRVLIVITNSRYFFSNASREGGLDKYERRIHSYYLHFRNSGNCRFCKQI